MRSRSSKQGTSPDALVASFLRWTWARAVFHRGWWLATSVYMVVEAGLTSSELVLVGSIQGVVALLCEVPAGVVADTFSRKWSLVLSHLLMGTAMLSTGLVTSFPAMVATQALYGLSWTFASGADVAWITDELDRPEAIAVVLSRRARAELAGSAAGFLGFGLLAWATYRSAAIVVAGAGMLALGVYVIARFPEVTFRRVHTARWSASWNIFRRGLLLVRRSREIRLIFLATFLIHGAADPLARLYPQQLLSQGLPAALDPMVWFTGLGIVSLLLGAVLLRIVQNRIDGIHARQDFALAAAVGAVGVALLAFPPAPAAAVAAVLLVAGGTDPLIRVIATVWVNSRTTSEIRATTHSFLAQAEYLGEITCGACIALVAQITNLPLALLACAALYASTALLMASPRRRPVG